MAGAIEDLEGIVSVVTIRGWASRDSREQGSCHSSHVEFSATEGINFSNTEGVGWSDPK